MTTPVNRADFLTFPSGTVRMEKPRPGDVRKLPDGSYDVTCRLTRVVMTTPEERAAEIRLARPGSWIAKEDADRIRAHIAAAIAAAEQEAVERCAKIADEYLAQFRHERDRPDGGIMAVSSAAKAAAVEAIAARIREARP